ncbi:MULTISPECIES: TonB family protein [unclassified Arsenophonus]|uniref:TonB family protein n=1 Tax=unclassified Arsenophonus TaxID=2627083 RepID=UPI00286519E0|nr:TonB family protein [Arsenophonus sp.]MDR5610908.1 TonB family protein [Arsenophonus sp.]MDR5614718.1 TonB family protein [Arsenophonus sp.]
MRWIRSASFIVLSLFLHASLAVSWFLLQPTLSASSAESMSVTMVALAAPSGISQSVNVKQRVTEIAPKIEPDAEAKLALPMKKKVTPKKSIVKQNSKSKQLVENHIKKTITEQSNQSQDNVVSKLASDDHVGVNNNQQTNQIASSSIAIDGPRALRIQHPDYPDRARKLGKEGYVNVLYDIDENGRVVNLEVVDSSPRGLFEREVKRAMNRWYYEKIPAKGLKKTFLFKIDGSINLS